MTTNYADESMIHPRVWEELSKKSDETGIPIHILMPSMFNKLSIEFLNKLGENIPVPEGIVTFYGSGGETYTAIRSNHREEKVVKTTATTAAPAATKPATKQAVAAPAATATDDFDGPEWMRGFPKRAINALTEAGIDSLEDLSANYGIEDLKTLKGMGEPTIERLLPVLESRGVKLHKGSLFNKKSEAPATKPADKPAKVATSEKASASLAAKNSELISKVSVSHLSDDEEIVEDHYGKMASIEMKDHNWALKAIDIYASAWGMAPDVARSNLIDILKATGLSMKRPEDWGKLREAACRALPSQEDQRDIIRSYAESNDLTVSQLVLANCGIEVDDLDEIDIAMAANLIAVINKANQEDKGEDWF